MTQLSVQQIVAALESLRPGAQWTVYAGGYETLDWVDLEQEKPTLAEITAEVARQELE